MQMAVVRKLRGEFIAAISSEQSDVTLDLAGARLRARISEADFLEPFSIYSRGQLRKMDGFLSRISSAALKDNPLRVALAVDAILKLFEGLEITVNESAASAKRIEEGRSG